MMTKVFFILCLWGTYAVLNDLKAQSKNVLDSLKKALKTASHDSTRALLYAELSRTYRHSKFDSSFFYVNKGIELARKINFQRGIATCLNGLGTLELNQGNYLVALKYALEALKINEKIGNQSEIAHTKNNVGEVYRLLRNHTKALQYYNEALVINRKINHKLGLAINLNNIGEIYTAQGEYTLALSHLLQSLEICQELKDKRRIALRYNNIGEVYAKQQDNLKAKQHFEKSLALNIEIDNKLYQSVAMYNLAKVLLKEGILDTETAQKSFEIAYSMKAKKEMTEALTVLIAIYEKQKKYELAYQNYKLLNQYKDSINIEEADKQTKQIQYDYEISKKEKEILLLEKDKKVEKQKQQIQFAYILAFGVGIVLLMVLAFLQYRRSVGEKKNKQLLQEKNAEIMSRQEELIAQKDLIDEQKKDLERAYQRMLRNERVLEKNIEKLKTSEASIEKQRKELEIQHDKISSSIKSAYVIQQAILPYNEKMQALLKNYFIIYMPKDIVSGDFWWLNEVENKIFLATIDCTGHGVAGAFMTMIGNTLLDKIVRLRGIYNPAEILEILHEEIQIVLRQKENKNNSGMDMSIICLEHIADTQTKITFAGAKHSIYYIDIENTTQILELKGTRKAIGGVQNENILFENNTIILRKGSWIYTGSDGLSDQNNEKRKRFGEQRIKEILVKYNLEKAQTQKIHIETALKEHMHNTEQRDDILWIGFQL